MPLSPLGPSLSGAIATIDPARSPWRHGLLSPGAVVFKQHSIVEAAGSVILGGK